MGRGLSAQQKKILAYVDTHEDVQSLHILRDVYGMQLRDALIKRRGLSPEAAAIIDKWMGFEKHFDTKQPGYNSKMASCSRSLRRLTDRGMISNVGGFWEMASKLP